ncbi:MAG: hypothetical protein M5T61_08200 [Acidimicrobiia bacterium]|nr:hypothetical protein [Acidimicrobiia bacterium]
MHRALVGAGFAAIAAFTIGACGGDDDAGKKLTESLIENATDGSVDINSDDGTITYSGEDGSGSISIGGGEMPDELADFPLPDGAQVLSSYSGSGDTGGGSYVGVVANGDYEEVAAGIESGLEDAGYTISNTYTAQANGVGTVSYTFEGDGTTGTVSVMEDSSTEGFDLLISITTSIDAPTG